MIVTGVALENIKSYGDREYARFEVGINSLRGDNGAGKSTILEAIGAALFNYVPYARNADMVRKGCSSGTISVDVLSELDGREYQVIRRLGRNPDYFVYEPETGLKVASGTELVLEWLRRHFELGADDDLPTLFQDTVGPAQGTFTAPFMMRPAERKAKFDVLLGVSDYEEAWQRLREVERWYETEASSLAATVERLRGRTERLAEAEGALDGLRAQRQRLQGQMKEQKERLQRARSELRTLTEASQARDSQERVCSTLREQLSGLLERVNAAQHRRDESHRAQATVEETRPAYEAYRRAEMARDELEARRRQREDLARQRQSLERALSVSETSLGHLQELLDKAIAAEQRLAELAPRVVEQEAAEAELERQRERERDLERLNESIPLAEERVRHLEHEVSRLDSEISAAEAARPVAAKVEDLRASLAERQELMQRLSGFRVELEAISAWEVENLPRLRKLQTQIEEWVREVRRLESLLPEAAALEGLEASLHEAREGRAASKVELEQARHARAQVSGGLCPFLEQPCRNLSEGEDLASRLDCRMVEAEERLAEWMAKLSVLEDKVRRARMTSTDVVKLDQLRAQIEQARSSVSELEEQLAARTQRREELGDVEGKMRSVSDERKALEHQLGQAQTAAVQVSALDGLLARRLECLSRLSKEEAELESLWKQRLGLADAPLKRLEAETRCRELGDARSLRLVAEKEAERRPALEKSIEEKLGDVAKLQTAIDELDQVLKGFAGLEEALSAQQALLRQHQKERDLHVSQLPIAEELEERESILQGLLSRQLAAERELRHAEDEALRLRAAFDEARYVEVQAFERDLDRAVAANEESIAHCDLQIGQLEADVAEMRRLAQEAEAGQREIAALERSLQFASQMRKYVRDAGPAVTRAILARISDVATSMYREIMDVVGVEVIWTSDYDIELHSRGHARSFRLLSGGEQMAAALSVRLALLRELSGINLAFLDEPTTNMDAERRSLLASQVPRIKGLRQLFVITHDAAFDSLAAHTVRVVKENDSSRIVLE